MNSLLAVFILRLLSLSLTSTSLAATRNSTGTMRQSGGIGGNAAGWRETAQDYIERMEY